MSKTTKITSQTEEIEIPEIELPQSIPPKIILTVAENEEDPEDITITENLNTISLSPRAVVDQKAKDAREARRFPPIPGFNPSLEQLGEWLKLLDDDMWSHLSVYLYRQWPMIVRQMSDPDNPKYIDIITKMQVEDGLTEHIQNTHGGGKYKIWVVDLDQKSAKGKYSTSIMEPTFKIDWNLYEPKLNLKEVDISNKNNVGFITQMVNKGVMDAKGNILQPTQQIGNGSGADIAAEMNKTFKEFFGMYTTMDKDKQTTINTMLKESIGKKGDDTGVTQLLLEKMKQDDPNKTTATMVSLINAMKEMQPKQDNSMINLLITQMNQSAMQMQQSFERQMKMMETMFTQQNSAKEEKSDDFIDKLIKYKTAMPELFGNGGREPKKELGELILEGAREFALPAIGLVSQFLQMNKGVAPIVPVTEQQARDVAAQAGMGAQPSPQAQHQQQRVIEMPSQPNQPNQPQTNAVKDSSGKPILDPNNLTPCQRLLIQYGGMLITAIKAGRNGAEIADSLEGAKPLLGDVYGMLKAQGGEKILEAMESIPEFWNQTGVVYGKEHMEQLVADFLIEPEEDEDEGNKDGKEIVQ